MEWCCEKKLVRRLIESRPPGLNALRLNRNPAAEFSVVIDS